MARDGSAARHLARRANALVLLDCGMSRAVVAREVLLDDDAIRTWRRLYQEDGIKKVASFGHEGSAGGVSAAQQGRLKAWVSATMPRTRTRSAP